MLPAGCQWLKSSSGFLPSWTPASVSILNRAGGGRGLCGRGGGDHYSNTNRRLRRCGAHEVPGAEARRREGRRPAMLRGALCLLLLLPLPGVPGLRGATSPGEAADESASPPAWADIQRLREQLRAAGSLSRRYWALFSCALWPDHCEDTEAPAPPRGWSLPLWGQRSLDILTTWFCRFQDCCIGGGDCRISNDFAGLESDLLVRLHGQHLAGQLVLRAVRSYLESPQADKALAVSFHGWSGTGKNFVARMLAENLFRDGLRSDCVKMFISMFHFPHPKYVDLYKEQLLSQIQETRQRCQQSMFILDEAEKLHPVLLDLLGAQLERRAPEAHRAKPLRTIFVFLSNLGGSAINEVVLGLLKAGWSREEILMAHLEPRLQAAITESPDSGFGRSRLVRENLIDIFIPFLPLEYRHVRLCVRDAFLNQELQYTDTALDEVARMMTYIPEEEQLFSSQGCKSISQRISYFLP